MTVHAIETTTRLCMADAEAAVRAAVAGEGLWARGPHAALSASTR